MPILSFFKTIADQNQAIILDYPTFHKSSLPFSHFPLFYINDKCSVLYVWALLVNMLWILEMFTQCYHIQIKIKINKVTNILFYSYDNCRNITTQCFAFDQVLVVIAVYCIGKMSIINKRQQCLFFFDNYGYISCCMNEK